ncbi:hypothetical protein [Pseudoroseomonas cervicalis]|uniref:hypothetical protein n=1 Tax=Teichococcus cervicalis TaxID=204525 RepID=UPI0027841E2F|nr:hypothetical protein [Pseudoroseomonas cervicalis]MDQ1081417.1 hypothetical protein [Pseudoroseomonas cervicalis]
MSELAKPYSEMRVQCPQHGGIIRLQADEVAKHLALEIVEDWNAGVRLNMTEVEVARLRDALTAFLGDARGSAVPGTSMTGGAAEPPADAKLRTDRQRQTMQLVLQRYEGVLRALTNRQAPYDGLLAAMHMPTETLKALWHSYDGISTSMPEISGEAVHFALCLRGEGEYCRV